jgi:hypothetical protein
VGVEIAAVDGKRASSAPLAAKTWASASLSLKPSSASAIAADISSWRERVP